PSAPSPPAARSLLPSASSLSPDLQPGRPQRRHHAVHRGLDFLSRQGPARVLVDEAESQALLARADPLTHVTIDDRHFLQQLAGVRADVRLDLRRGYALVGDRGE